MEFTHEKLLDYFDGIRQTKSNSTFDFNYVVSEAKGDIAKIMYLGKNEWRVFIDNFPGQKKYYQTNFPITTLERFVSEMKSIGLAQLKRGVVLDYASPLIQEVERLKAELEKVSTAGQKKQKERGREIAQEFEQAISQLFEKLKNVNDTANNATLACIQSQQREAELVEALAAVKRHGLIEKDGYETVLSIIAEALKNE